MATGRVIKRNGKWAYVISLPYDPVKGRYPQKWKSGFETKKAAQEALTMELANMDDRPITSDFTVLEYGQRYLQSIESNKAPRTHEVYTYTLNKYIYPYIGHVKLDKLQPDQIEKMYKELQKTLAPSTVHRAHRVLRSMLNRAVKQNHISRSPLMRVEPPSGKSAHRTPLTIAEIHQVLEWLQEHFFISYLAAYLAIQTGMRRAEICGLRWRDADLELAVIRVVQSRQRRKGKDIIGSPKTAGSVRPIPVGQEVIEKLKAWKSELQTHTQMRGQMWNEEMFVIQRQDGQTIDPNSVTADLRKGLKALELPPSSFHDLRHAHATILLQANVPLKVVSERLGHANIVLTANTYAHVTETMQRAAVDKLSEALKQRTD